MVLKYKSIFFRIPFKARWRSFEGRQPQMFFARSIQTTIDETDKLGRVGLRLGCGTKIKL